MTDELAYVCGHNGGIMVVDVTTQTQIDTWNSPANYQYCALSSDLKKLYATTAAGIDQFDTTTGTLSAAATLLNAYGLYPTPDDSKLYVANTGNQVQVYSTPSLTPITNVSGIPGSPGGIDFVTVSPDGTMGYASESGNTGGVVQWDVATDTVIASIGFPTNHNASTYLAIAADGMTGWVADGRAGLMAFLDLATLALTSEVAITPPSQGNMPYKSPFIYSTSNGILSKYSSTANAEVASAATGASFSADCAFTPSQGLILIPDLANPTLYLVDPSSLATVGTVTLSSNGFGVASSPAFPKPTPPPPSSITVPFLFIPRKGLGNYSPADVMTNLLAIERWANSWAPPLFLPAKPTGRMPTPAEINQDWLEIERWSQTTAYQKGQTG